VLFQQEQLLYLASTSAKVPEEDNTGLEMLALPGYWDAIYPTEKGICQSVKDWVGGRDGRPQFSPIDMSDDK
jgi:hypothetical protein